MNTFSSLAARDLFALALRIDFDLDRLGGPPPPEQPRPPYRPVGLLASPMSDLVEVPPLQSDRAFAWRDEVAALEASIETNDTTAAISQEASYAVMRTALARQATLRGRKFADPRASLWLFVGADPILTHPADPILTRGWTPTA